MLRALVLVGVFLAGLGPASPVQAQIQGQNPWESSPNLADSLSKNEQISPGDQKIERLHYEDSATRIEELRVGGESQSISVQSRLPVPGWQVLRNESARGNGLNDSTAGKRQRVWNILDF